MTSASPSAVINAVVRDEDPAGDWPSQPTSPGLLTVVWSVICLVPSCRGTGSTSGDGNLEDLDLGAARVPCLDHTHCFCLSFFLAAPPPLPLLLFGFPSVAVSTSFNSFLKLKTTWIHSEDLI